jgi:hypothetical protein
MLTIPTASVDQTLALASRLLAAAPKEASEDLSRALQAIADRQTDLLTLANYKSESLKKRTTSTKRRSDADARFDHAWALVYQRLDAYAQLPIERFARAADAQHLKQQLFAEGLTFLQHKYMAKWGASEVKLAKLVGRLENDFMTFVGTEFLVEVLEAHADLGDVLQADSESPPPTPSELNDALLALRRAMRIYARKMVASVDEGSPHSERAAATALRAIGELKAQLRAERRKRRASHNPPE